MERYARKRYFPAQKAAQILDPFCHSSVQFVGKRFFTSELRIGQVVIMDHDAFHKFQETKSFIEVLVVEFSFSSLLTEFKSY